MNAFIQGIVSVLFKFDILPTFQLDKDVGPRRWGSQTFRLPQGRAHGAVRKILPCVFHCGQNSVRGVPVRGLRCSLCYAGLDQIRLVSLLADRQLCFLLGLLRIQDRISRINLNITFCLEEMSAHIHKDCGNGRLVRGQENR